MFNKLLKEIVSKGIHHEKHKVLSDFVQNLLNDGSIASFNRLLQQTASTLFLGHCHNLTSNVLDRQCLRFHVTEGTSSVQSRTMMSIGTSTGIVGVMIAVIVIVVVAVTVAASAIAPVVSSTALLLVMIIGPSSIASVVVVVAPTSAVAIVIVVVVVVAVIPSATPTAARTVIAVSSVAITALASTNTIGTTIRTTIMTVAPILASTSIETTIHLRVTLLEVLLMAMVLLHHHLMLLIPVVLRLRHEGHLYTVSHHHHWVISVVPRVMAVTIDHMRRYTVAVTLKAWPRIAEVHMFERCRYTSLLRWGYHICGVVG